VIDDTTGQGLADLAVLAEPLRRRLYLHVIGQSEPVGRDDAAGALGIGRSLAAFHLDRLVEAGLLTTEFRRLSGRSGPGAGRPAKLYLSSGREVRATVPHRRYEVAAKLFASALTSEDPGPDALVEAAGAYGTELGSEARHRAGPRSGRGGRMKALTSVLRDAGYVPFQRGDELRLRNCPFHELAERHRQLTCGMNLALVRGMLDGAGLPAETARLDWQPGQCCVAISTGPA
jgi:predicted ArsR family transcriptional regulator